MALSGHSRGSTESELLDQEAKKIVYWQEQLATIMLREVCYHITGINVSGTHERLPGVPTF